MIREEDHGNAISQLYSVPKILNSPTSSPTSMALGDKKFDAISDSHHHFLMPSPFPIYPLCLLSIGSLSSKYAFKLTFRYCHFTVHLDTHIHTAFSWSGKEPPTVTDLGIHASIGLVHSLNTNQCCTHSPSRGKLPSVRKSTLLINELENIAYYFAVLAM